MLNVKVGAAMNCVGYWYSFYPRLIWRQTGMPSKNNEKIKAISDHL